MSTIPPPEPGHSITDLLRLVDEIKRLAFARSLSNDDSARGVRDLLREHAGEFEDHDD